MSPGRHSAWTWKVLDLPAGAPEACLVRPAFPQREMKDLEGRLNPWKPRIITLKPFEVLVFEALPAPP